MNLNDSQPTEGNNMQSQGAVNQPQAVPPKENKSIFGNIVDSVAGFAGSAYKNVSNALLMGKKTFEKTAENIQNGEYNKIFQSPMERFGLDKYQNKKVTLTDTERNQVEKLKNLSGGQQAADLFGTLGTGIKNVLGFGPSFKTKNDKKEFESSLDGFNTRQQEVQKKIQGIYESDEFIEINEFNKDIKKRYLEQKGLAKIEDDNDFQNFARAEFEKLDVFQQKKFSEQETLRQERAAQLFEESQKIETEKDYYIETNVEGGKAEYLKFQSEIENQFKNNKTMEIHQEIENDVKKQLEGYFARNAKAHAHIKGYERKREEFEEDEVNTQHQFLKLAGMDIPHKDELLSLYKETAMARREYKSNILNKVAELSQDPQYKELDDVALFSKAEEFTWKETPKESQGLIRSNDLLTKAIDQENNLSEIKKFNLFDLGSVASSAYNTLNAGGNILGQAFNMSYDIEDADGIPTFIRKDNRNIKYADEAWYNRMTSVIAYNPDELASIFIGMKGADKIAKAASKMDKAFDAVQASIKFPSGTANYWVGKGINGTAAIVQKARTSFIEGAVSDPIIDTAMGEVGGANQDALNMITNIVFDTAVIPALGKGFQVGRKGAYATADAVNTSMNSLVYRYMVNPEDKAVVKDFVKGLADKGYEATEQQAFKVLDESKKIYYKSINEKVIEDTFKKPGEMFQFLKTNLEHMEDAKLKQIVTERGMGIEITDALNIPKESVTNLNTLYETAFKEGIDPTKTKLLTEIFNKNLEDVNKFLDGSVYKGNRIQNEMRKNPEFIEILNNSKTLISNIKSFGTKKGFNTEIQEATRKLVSNLETINSKYTVIRSQKTVTLRNMENPIETMTINMDELPAMAGKNWDEIVREGKVTFKKGDDEVVYNLSTKAEENVHQIGHQHIQKYKQAFIDFMNENRHLIMVDSSGQALDSIMNTAKNILFATGKVKLQFAEQSGNLKSANEILKNFTKLLQQIGDDYYGKGTFTHINDINELMDSKALKKYDEERNGVDVGDLMQYLDDQDGKFNISHGTFKGKDGKIAATVYFSFGKELNNPEFMKTITAKTVNKKGKEVYNFANYINKFAAVHKNIIEHGIEKDGSLNLEKGIIRTRGIISANKGESLFQDGILSYEKVKEFLATLNIKDQGMVDKISHMIIEMFGHDISQHNNMILPMIMSFTFNYVKNKELIDAFLKNVDKLNVKSNELDALSHLLLYGDDNYITKVAKGFKESAASKEMTEQLGSFIKGTIDTEIKMQHETYLSQIYDIESRMDELINFIKQLSDPIQIQKMEQQLSDLGAMKASIQQQIKNIENLRESKMEDKMLEIYRSYLISHSKNLSADILTGMRQTYKNITDKIKSLKENKKIVQGLSDDDKKIFKQFIEEIQEAKKEQSASAFNAIIEKYKSNNFSKELNKTFERILKDIHFSEIELNLFDEKQLQSDLTKMQGVFNDDYIKDPMNNPIIIGVKYVLNMSENDRYPEISSVFKEMFGINKPEDLILANNKNPKYHEFINSIIATNDNYKDINVQESLRKFLKEMYGSYIYKTNTSENVIDDLIEKAIHDKTFINTIKKIKLYSQNDNILSYSKVGKSKELSQTKNVHLLPQTVRQMFDAGMEMKFVEGLGYRDLATFTGDIIGVKSNSEVIGNIAKAFERYFNYGDIVNSQGTKMPFKQAKKEIDVPREYVFISSFGDKDSFFGFYKPSIEMPAGLSREDYSDIVKEIYTYHYADVKGFYNNSNFNEFLQAIEGFKNKQDFQQRVDKWIADNNGETIIKIQNIRKRESALMSTRNTFDEVKQPIHTFILEEVEQTDDYIFPEYVKHLLKFMESIQDEADDLIKKGELAEADAKKYIVEQFKNKPYTYEVDGVEHTLEFNFENVHKKFHEELGRKDYENYRSFSELEYSEEEMYDRLARYLEGNYVTGLEDGTSYINKNLFELRERLNNSPKGLKAFKDHMQGITKGKAFLGKTLFNKSSIQYTPELKQYLKDNKFDHEFEDNIVLIGENSHKLKGDYHKMKEPMYIMLNGVRRKVLGYVEGTDTSFFKEATTDVAHHGESVSLSSSISVKFPEIYENAITNVQKEEIVNIINEGLEGITDYRINSTAFDDINSILRKVSSIFEGGVGTVNLLKDKAKMMNDKIIEVIQKPMGQGQSKLIYHSDRRLKPDTILVHRDSPLLKQAKKNSGGKPPFYVIGYRYPVPSTYNLGVYEIKTVDDFDADYFGGGKIGKEKLEQFKKDYSNLGVEHVVPHPQVTYLKIEGDNDGDHFNFVDVNDKYAKIYAKGLLGIPLDKEGSITELITDVRNVHDGNIPNKYIITPQVQKGSSDNVKKDVRKSAADLIDSRHIALEAKSKVSEISSTIRTIYILDKVFHDIERNGEKSIYYNIPFKYKTDDADNTLYMHEFYQRYYKDNPNYPKGELTEKFKENSAMILQLALDFGSKDADKFPEDWMENLLKGIGIDITDSDDTILKQFLTYLSTGYNQYKPKNLDELVTGALLRPGNENVAVDPKILSRKGIQNMKSIKKDLNPEFLLKLGAQAELYRFAAINPHLQLFSGFAENNFDPHIVYNMMEDQFGKSNPKLKPLFDILDSIDTMKYYNSGKTKYVFDKKTGPEFYRYLKADNAKADQIKGVYGNGTITLKNGNKTTFKNLFDEIDNILFDKFPKKRLVGRYALQKNFIAKINADELPDEVRYVISFYSALRGEQQLFQYITEANHTKFLLQSQMLSQFREKKLLRKIGKKYEVPVQQEKQSDNSYLKTLNTLFERVNNEVKKLKELNTQKDTIKINEDEINKLSQFASNIKEKAETIKNSTHVEAEKIDNQFVHEYTEVPKLNIPEVKSKQVLAHPHALEELMSENINVVSLARDGVKMTMQSLFTKYMPSLVTTFDAIQNFMNKYQDRRLDFANRIHVQQFGDNMLFGMVGNKNSIYQFLKREGKTQEEIDNLSRLIQKEFIFIKDGKYYVNNVGVVKKNLSSLFETQGMRNLTEDPQFMEQVAEYQEKVMIPLVQSMREMHELMGFDFGKAYKNVDFSIVNDMFAAMKGDPQVALKLHGIDSEAQFMEQLQSNADAMGVRITNFVKKSMRDVVFKQKLSWYEQILGFLQSFHYNLTYGTGATFLHGTNIIAGLAQVLPNYSEIRAYARGNMDDMVYALKAMDSYNLMQMEDQLKFGTGHGKNLRPDWAEKYIGALTKGTVEGAMQGFNKALNVVSNGKLNVNDTTIMRAGEHVDSFVNNILGWNDSPLDNFRKITAVVEEAKSLGVQLKDLDSFLENLGELGIQKFNQRVHMRYVNSGGGAVSSSPIGRGTLIEHAHNLVDNYIGHHILKFFIKSNSYLMGWAFHKTSHFIEKEAAIGTAMKRLFHGDIQGFSAHLDDWIAFNSMAMKQMLYAAGLYMQFQKYEKDNDDKTDFMSFQKSYNNFLVSFGILFEKHIKNWETAGEYGDGLGDQIGYTAYGIYKQTFRLMKQANVVETMYHKYLADKAIADETGKEASIVDAFYYAMEKHYQGYMTFNAMQKMDDLHNTVQTDSNLGILGTGVNTKEEDLLNDLTGGKQFASFKDQDALTMLLKGMFSNGNLFSNLFSNNKMMNNQVAISIAKDLNESIHNNNPNLHNLLTGGSIGQEYQLETLLGSGKNITDEEKNLVKQLWQHAATSKDYFDLKENGRRNLVNATTGKKYEEGHLATHLEKQIDEELAKQGLTFKDLFEKHPDKDRGDLKQMVVMQMKLNISTPTMISYILNKEYSEQRSELAKKIGTKSPGEKYKKLNDEQDLALKRDILLKYQDKFNLDRETVNKIVQIDVRKNHGDSLERIENTFKAGNFSDDNLFKLMHTDYLVHRVMGEGDTSVSALKTKYALAYSGFPANETSVKVMLDHLQEMENLPWKDKKEKLAHQAAMIYGMGKTYNYFSDNKKFQEMTQAGQKLLANWMYKISSEASDYDSKSPTSEVNYRSSYRKGIGSFRPRYQTKAFSGQRPNFSKQFQPMRQQMSGRNLVEADPQQFITKANEAKQKQSAPYMKEANPFYYQIRQHQMPEMIEYTRYFINAKINNYQKPQTDNNNEKENSSGPKITKMRTSRPKKAKTPKTQKITGRKPPKKYSRGVRPNLPFSNYEG